MKKMHNIFVSVVLVVDEHSLKCAGRVVKIMNILKKAYENYELIIIDNGLPATQLTETKELLPQVSCLRIVRLARSDDTDTAIFAGVECAIGDYICILHNIDPIELIPEFIKKNIETDIVFGVARNLFRKTFLERQGTKLFYWYNRKYLRIYIPTGSTYFISLNRNAANALTRNNRAVRHIRQLASLVGFDSQNLEYDLPKNTVYSHIKRRDLIIKALDLAFGYSSHPIRAVSYFGVIAAILNLGYAVYVVVINLSVNNVAKGWTTLSIQASIMFFFMFMIMAVLAEYIGKILVESRKEPAYHIMQELSSTINIADETRRNVSK